MSDSEATEKAAQPADDKAVEQHGEIPELDPNNPDVRTMNYKFNMRTGHCSLSTNCIGAGETVTLLSQIMMMLGQRVAADEAELSMHRIKESGGGIVKPGDAGFGVVPGVGLPSVFKGGKAN
jgi:hypothetical protein